jgi:hypothetical protein
MDYEDEEMETSEAADEVVSESPSESTEAVEVSSDGESVESDAPSEVAEAAPEITEPEYRFPEFDFGGWDGEAEALPEAYRPIHGQISGRLTKDMDSLRNSLEQDRELYQALLEGEDVGKDFQQKLAAAQGEAEKHGKAQTTWAEEKAQYDKQIQEYQGQMQQVEAHRQTEANDWAREFRKTHDDVLSQTDKRDQFSQFLNSGVDAEIAMEFVRSGNERFVNSTLGYISQGVPANYAIRMAKVDTGTVETQAAQPRAGAEMTAGALDSTNIPQSAEKAVSDKSFGIRDARRLAVERAFKRRTG